MTIKGGEERAVGQKTYLTGNINEAKVEEEGRRRKEEEGGGRYL